MRHLVPPVRRQGYMAQLLRRKGGQHLLRILRHWDPLHHQVLPLRHSRVLQDRVWRHQPSLDLLRQLHLTLLYLIHLLLHLGLLHAHSMVS
jgi:hypothetical protein